MPNKWGSGYNTVSYVTKTKLELAKEAKDIALKNLVSASEMLGRAQKNYREALEEKPCDTCKWGPK